MLEPIRYSTECQEKNECEFACSRTIIKKDSFVKSLTILTAIYYGIADFTPAIPQLWRERQEIEGKRGIL
jgi:hypothetical protein